MTTSTALRGSSRALGRLPALLAIAAMLLAIALLDEKTGLFHLTVLYAIPIIVATWAFGLVGGLITGAIAIVSVGATHTLLHSPTVVADVATDLVVFVTAAVVVDRLRSQLATIRSLEERRDFDLGLAQDIERRMLRPPPEDARFEIAVALDFAREVGGDYYRFAEAGDDLVLFAGDISGKGMSAALFAVLLDDGITEALAASLSLPETVGALNRRLYAGMPPEMFVTMLFAVISDKTLSFVNAGHVRPLLFRVASGKAREIAEEPAMPLGIEPDLDVPVHTLRLSPGDTFLVCSDGVTESPALLDAPDRLLTKFEEAAPRGCREVVEAVRRLAESRGQTDDVTVICLRRQ